MRKFGSQQERKVGDKSVMILLGPVLTNHSVPIIMTNVALLTTNGSYFPVFVPVWSFVFKPELGL